MNVWTRLRDGLEATRRRLRDGLGGVLGLTGSVDAASLERLEEALLGADVGPATSERLIARARETLARDRTVDLRAALERAADEMVGGVRVTFAPGPERPWVALLVGVNGVGKTTLAGKLAARFVQDGHPTLLVAGDTFRAAAAEQLEVWAGRAGVEVVRARGDADRAVDPASVVHDGLTAARARGMHAVLVDTAGRLHTRRPLMEELEKIVRVCGRLVPGAPHHTLLVLDATVGQNGLAQAREFQRVLPITSLALTKLDGTSRGGVLLAIADQLALPISVVGVGEGLDDWEAFDPEAYAKGLFD